MYYHSKFQLSNIHHYNYEITRRFFWVKIKVLMLLQKNNSKNVTSRHLPRIYSHYTKYKDERMGGLPSFKAGEILKDCD